MNRKIKLAILISGNGSNMRALIDDMESSDHPAETALVISDSSNAKGLKIAQEKNIQAVAINFHEFPNPSAFETKLMGTIQLAGIDFICLAGFMRILSPSFVREFKNRILNIHPSLLPLFKGLRTHEKALKSGMIFHGATVHVVTEKLDSGKILGQAIVPIHKNDTKATLASRVLKLEHKLYPTVLKNFLQGKTDPIILTEIKNF